ncbi:MAG: malto-oligosyltrehalose trehalohydrolase [Microvirga sp.]
MSFGAAVLAAGGVRFRLWAPAARSVELVIDGRAKRMQSQPDGWYELVDREARAGTLYQYAIDGKQLVPDPASRFQPQDVDGPSEVIDPRKYPWKDAGWKSRPWREAVIYELHVGTFTPEGTYRAAIEKLRHLAEHGITAIELMPLADFAGKRNWGYDGVLPYAPDSAYGRPEELKALIDTAHAAGLMVFLDVVYNHFGPKGNYLALYAPEFFTERHKTPWGAAINFAHPVVRQYFVHNVLYWLEEYHFDGLRFDAVHAIHDDSPRHILDEIRAAVPARKHLVLENDANQARFVGPGKYNAQWNDDSHHAYHVLATREADGYYVSYADNPARHLARCLAEGFAYQGELSPFSREPRGERSSHLPASCFVDFLQNHDQIGNRAFGERIAELAVPEHLALARAGLLLSPQIPMLYMGEEWAASAPFLFFVDFSDDPELSQAVRDGRQREFANFRGFAEQHGERDIPDPTAEETFRRSVLDWSEAERSPHAEARDEVRRLLRLRQGEVVPLTRSAFCGAAHAVPAPRMLDVTWRFAAGTLRFVANFDEASRAFDAPAGTRVLWSNAGLPQGETMRLRPWTGAVLKSEPK